MLNRDWLKRFDVTEIVLPVEFADAIFGGREATTGNASAVRRLGPNLCFCALVMVLNRVFWQEFFN